MTERWNKIVEKGIRGLTGPRLQYWLCQVRFIVVAAGRRSLKTELAKRKLAWAFIHSEPGSRYGYCAPTEGQAKAIAWKDLKALVPRKLVAKINESELSIVLITGSELHCIGLDKAQRLEGTPWNGLVLDEFADIKQGVLEHNILPAIADRNGFLIIIGVPDYEKPNNAKFKELFELGLSGTDPEWISFTWPSDEVMTDVQVATLRANMTPLLFRQEVYASFETAPGRAYPEFVRTIHVSEEYDYMPELPIRLCCDFNYIHHNWVLAQIVDGCYRAFDVLYLQNATVESMMNLFDDKVSQYRSKSENSSTDLCFYGDYTGVQRRSEATYSAWMQLRRRYQGKEFFVHKQPPISDRLDAVNISLMNAAGDKRIQVHPRCVNLITDFEEVPRQLVFNKGNEGKLTHASDAFGYFVYEEERKKRIRK